ncbi:MAG: hypothetical protein ACTSY1_02080 [Alphaproteobacteria bacterium]
MSTEPQRTTLVDVDIPFFRMMVLFIKIGLAAVPAAFVLSIVFGLIALAFGGLFGGLGMMFDGTMMQ